MLAANGVDKSFGRTHALQSVELSAKAAEVHALLGENGAGKSTLMHILAGALPYDAGRITIGGQPYTPSSPSEARRAGVAMVHQEPQLCDHLSVMDNIALGSEPSRFGWLQPRAIARRARSALAQIAPDSGIALSASVASLPPGDRQLVAIARALSQGQLRLLILDEPTSSLTARDTERLFDAVGRLREAGHTIIYISHFLEEVERIADRYTVLRDGETVASGTMADTTLDALVTAMVGHALQDAYPRSPHTIGELVMEVTELACQPLPRRATLSLHAGEVLGIAGLVGSGRTELMRALFGLDRVTSGQLRIGSYHGWAGPGARLEQRVGMLSEDRKGEGLAANLSIADNLTLSKLRGLGPAGLVLPRRRRKVAQRWAEELSIRCRDVAQPVSDLSGGNQQKVAIARLLYHDVDVLLLDEPTRGIDVKSRAAVYRLIDRSACAGKAVLMVSSYLPELMGVCDRIAVMCRGVLGQARPVEDVTRHSLLMEATGA